MPEGTIGLAPDSTGGKVRTRTRTVGANTVHEQYMLPGKEPVVLNRSWLSTPRARSRAVAVAAAASQVMFTVWNGGTNLVSMRRLSVECDSANARAGTASPWLRMYRITAAPANGTTATPVQQDTNDAALTVNVVVRHDGATTDTGALPTALSVTGLGAVGTAIPMWAQTCPRLIANQGIIVPSLMLLTPDDPRLNAEDPVIMRPSQGIAVRFESPVVATNAWLADDWTFHFKAVLAEFTYP